MSRVKRGTTARRRRNKVLKEAKGFFGSRSKTYRKANETLMRSWAFAFRDRRAKKRMMRRLWIVRINAAAREEGLSYSQFMCGVAKAGIRVDRKVLADMAVQDPAGFGQIAGLARQQLPQGAPPPSSPEGIPLAAGNTHA